MMFGSASIHETRFAPASLVCAALSAICLSPSTAAAREPAITAFTAACFNKGYTQQRITQAMEHAIGGPLSFDLTFWDKALAPAPNTSDFHERRCEVAFAGDHTQTAIDALREKMATPPVFGHKIPLPVTHAANSGTALIEGRELLRGRTAVIQIGTRPTQTGIETYIIVDRLPANWQDQLQ
ncbi:hypothetical protein OAC63_02805 [Amylibacter sp.]|jgi:hypothetical protein|nr:hypothetical protein [Amylibacter sp.]